MTLFGATQIELPLTLVTGAIVVAVPYWNNAAATPQVSASTLPTFTSLPKQKPAGCGANAQIFYATVPAAGSDNIVFTQSTGSDALGLAVAEYTGISAPDADVGAVAPSSSNAMTLGSLVAPSSGVVLALFNDSVGSGMMIPGSGFSGVTFDTAAYAMLELRVVGPGAVDVTGSLPMGTSNSCWVGTAAAFPSP